MPITPLDTLERGVEDKVQNQLRAAQSQVSRNTSIVRLANDCLTSRIKQSGQEREKSSPKLRQGVYAQSTLDGYRRTSPVQEVQTAPGYRAAILKRVVGTAAAVLALAALVLFLLYIL